MYVIHPSASVAAIFTARPGPPAIRKQIDDAITDVLTRLLAGAGITDAGEHAHAITSYMVGATLRQLYSELPPQHLTTDIARLSGLPAR
jgi:hypothetical protein